MIHGLFLQKVWNNKEVFIHWKKDPVLMRYSSFYEKSDIEEGILVFITY